MKSSTKKVLWISLGFLWLFPQMLLAQSAPASASAQGRESQVAEQPRKGTPVSKEQTSGKPASSGQDKKAPPSAEEKTTESKEVPELEKTREVQVRKQMKHELPQDKKLLLANEALYKKTKILDKPSLKIFGHDFFTSGKASFDPLEAVPVHKDYIIGPGDELKVVLWGRMDVSYDLEVNQDGQVIFPKVGPLTVAGLSYADVEELFKLKLGAMTGVNINVSMSKLRSIQVFVLGEVKKPGIYLVSALASIANALTAAGGLTPLGSLRQIELRRSKELLLTCDLYDFLLKGDTTSDARLMSADVIFVPQAGPKVAISGNVKRPAIYELKHDKSIETAINFAGGLKPEAYAQRLQIMRPFEHRVKLILDAAYDEAVAKKELELQDGDWISVASILPSPVNAVFLYGNVERPGRYEYREGYRVSDILSGLDALAMDTYFDYGVVKRYQLEDMEPELIPFNVGTLLFLKDDTQNISLKPLDEIYVFNKWAFEDRPYATVKGEVRNPGRCYLEEMRIKDLVFKAGDLTEDAYLQRAELIRTEEDRSKRTIYVDLTEAMSGNPNANIKVQNEDMLIVHSIWETEWKKFVNIRGEIKKPGKYPLTNGMRLGDLIFKSGNLTQDAYEKIGHVYRTDWRTKEVTIHTFNVQKALEETPEHPDDALENNLLLQEGDRVVIHSIWEYKPKYTVTIKGGVHKPGQYPFAENMTVRDLIVVGGNIKESAYLKKGELIRYEIRDGEKVVSSLVSFDVMQALQKEPPHNLPLRPMDVVSIKKIPGWEEKKKKVVLTGEVRFPGTYQILNDERLSNALARAGGVTENGYLRGAVFTRVAAQKKQQAELNDLIQKLALDMASMTALENEVFLSEEAIQNRAYVVAAQKGLLTKLKEKKPEGRVILSLLPAEKMAGNGSDILLEDGDTLFIPENPNTVHVIGAVYQSVTAVYNEKENTVADYLNMAGGPTKDAQKDEIYIACADGRIISKSSRPKRFEKTVIYPGDCIVVPYRGIRPAYLYPLSKDLRPPK